MLSERTASVDRGPAVPFPPPLLFVAGFGVGLLLSRLVPLAFPWSAARWTPPVALLLIVLGLGVMLLGMLTFRRAKTAVYPNQPARTVVTHGVYARTRNPMYVGLTVAYVGGVIATRSVWALLVLPIVLVVLVRQVVRREERYLLAAFPAEYEAYCEEVGRWL
jgi:protein-S-isoprenylcysteine O-methyltransferase Ste14